MIVATVFFMLGSFFYKKVPPKENVIFRVAGTMRVNFKKMALNSRLLWGIRCVRVRKKSTGSIISWIPTIARTTLNAALFGVARNIPRSVLKYDLVMKFENFSGEIR